MEHFGLKASPFAFALCSKAATSECCMSAALPYFLHKRAQDLRATAQLLTISSSSSSSKISYPCHAQPLDASTLHGICLAPGRTCTCACATCHCYASYRAVRALALSCSVIYHLYRRAKGEILGISLLHQSITIPFRVQVSKLWFHSDFHISDSNFEFRIPILYCDLSLKQ